MKTAISYSEVKPAIDVIVNSNKIILVVEITENNHMFFVVSFFEPSVSSGTSAIDFAMLKGHDITDLLSKHVVNFVNAPTFIQQLEAQLHAEIPMKLEFSNKYRWFKLSKL